TPRVCHAYWPGKHDMTLEIFEKFLSATRHYLATTAPENLAMATLLAAVSAAFFAFLAFVFSLRKRNSAAPSESEAAELVREAADQLKAAVDERERRMVIGLGEVIVERTRDFGTKIDRFITQIDARAEAIGQRLLGDLAQLSGEVTHNRDSL